MPVANVQIPTKLKVISKRADNCRILRLGSKQIGCAFDQAMWLIHTIRVARARLVISGVKQYVAISATIDTCTSEEVTSVTIIKLIEVAADGQHIKYATSNLINAGHDYPITVVLMSHEIYMNKYIWLIQRNI